MKTVENLVRRNENLRIGNHRLEMVQNNRGQWISKYYYYSTVIVLVNEASSNFFTDTSYGSVSTKRAVNAYIAELEDLGYMHLGERKELNYLDINEPLLSIAVKED